MIKELAERLSDVGGQVVHKHVVIRDPASGLNIAAGPLDEGADVDAVEARLRAMLAKNADEAAAHRKDAAEGRNRRMVGCFAFDVAKYRADADAFLARYTADRLAAA